MGKFFTGFNGRIFWMGALGSSPLSFAALLSVPFNWNSVVLVVAAKMAGGCILSFFSGIALALANDFYKHQLRHRFEKIVKPKKHEKENDNERSA